MSRHCLPSIIIVMATCFVNYGNTSAQFIDDFKSNQNEGWTWFTGDGLVEMDFVECDGIASILVDATADTHNVWWALIKRDVSAFLNLERLAEPEYELRVEARIRVSHAPRRVNLHFNTQRTTDFHSHLREYDIADTTSWHRISMTTRDFDARPGDAVNVQMALMDWGLDRFRVDLDYIRVDVASADTSAPDSGHPIPYHSTVPDEAAFDRRLVPDQAVVVVGTDASSRDSGQQDLIPELAGSVLSLGKDRLIAFRWDLADYRETGISGPGLLKLVTRHAARETATLEELGQVRVSEVYEANWPSHAGGLSESSFLGGRPRDEVINPQMIIDLPLKEGRDVTTYFTIPVPVMERLVSGLTSGLAVRALGVVEAEFYGPNVDGEGLRPELMFGRDSDGSLEPGTLDSPRLHLLNGMVTRPSRQRHVGDRGILARG
ncbi:MAG TPA: hypothetical protein VMO47_12860 [Rhodothermales bacterium]|nr:hypothetical protein [Rhodothermales bacterium]